MATKIFVNLPVRNLNKSVDFFTKLGFSFNPQFTDETATCMIEDYGFMYAHGFQDPDGHIWELVYMEPSAIKQTA